MNYFARRILPALCACGLALGGALRAAETNTAPAAPRIILENEALRAEVTPARGAALAALVAKATDLSMAGLKLIGDFGSADDRMTLSIPIPGGREVVTQATVRRRGEEELALEFDQLDWDDMFALARFLHPRLP